MLKERRSGTSFQHSFGDGLAGWKVMGPTTQVGPWLGREAVRIEGGGVLLAPVRPEAPYSVEVTLAGGAGECYVGACFHLQDPNNYETVYLAPHLGGKPEAVQYDPALNGSMTWQVFSDGAALAAVPLGRETWRRLRLDVWPDVAQVLVDGNEAAIFALRTGFRSGRLGLWSYLPCYVADFAVARLATPAPAGPNGAEPPEGTVREWLVAREEDGPIADQQRLSVETNGTLCFNRLWSIDASSALAACEVLIPDLVRELTLELGYSDRANVWWDGALVHEGEWRWSPKKGTDGRIRPGRTRIVLPASVPGYHQLRVRVEVAEPFGWGLTARVLADGVPCEWCETAAAPALD